MTSIGGDLSIHNNYSLTSLTGMDGLTSIGRDLSIWSNTLTNLTALNNLTSIGGNLFIEYNDALTSLTGLNNIDAGSITNLYVSGNGSLSTCEMQSICDYLANPNGGITISDNAMGCDSKAEVQSACAVISVDEISIGNALAIYPNPSSTNITIESPSIDHLTILNLNGQEIITRQITGPKTKLDISNLPGGVYFVRLTNDRTVTVGKIIKQ